MTYIHAYIMNEYKKESISDVGFFFFTSSVTITLGAGCVVLLQAEEAASSLITATIVSAS